MAEKKKGTGTKKESTSKNSSTKKKTTNSVNKTNVKSSTTKGATTKSSGSSAKKGSGKKKNYSKKRKYTKKKTSTSAKKTIKKESIVKNVVEKDETLKEIKYEEPVEISKNEEIPEIQIEDKEDSQFDNTIQLELPLNIETKKESIFKDMFDKYKSIALLILIALFVFLIVVFGVKQIKNSNRNTNAFQKINFSEYLDLYATTNNNLNFIYLSDANCTNCSIYEANLAKLKKEFSIDINKLNISSLSEKELDKLKESTEIFKDGFIFPILLSVQNGKMINEISGIKEYAALKKFVNVSKEPSNTDFNEISVTRYMSLLNSKDKIIIYIGRSSDKTCENYSKILNRVSSNFNLKVYYLDTDQINTEENWNKLKESNEIFKKDWFVPVTIIVKDGKIYNYKMEAINEEDLNKFLAK